MKNFIIVFFIALISRATPTKKKINQYRVAYKINNEVYFGSWFKNKELIEVWVVWGNENYPNISHWVDGS